MWQGVVVGVVAVGYRGCDRRRKWFGRGPEGWGEAGLRAGVTAVCIEGGMEVFSYRKVRATMASSVGKTRREGGEGVENGGNV